MKIIRVLNLFFLIIMLSSNIFSRAPSDYPMSLSAEFDDDKVSVLIFEVIIELPQFTHITSEFLSKELIIDEELKIIEYSFHEPVFYSGEIIYRDKGYFRSQIDISSFRDKGIITLQGKISYQICEELPFEQCLPPSERFFKAEIDVDPAGKKAVILSFAELDELSIPEPETQKIKEQIHIDAAPESRLESALSESILYAVLMVFIAGILTSFTPCVYPLIPITIAVFSKDHGSGNNKLRGFFRSLFYVLGLCITYSILGLISGMTGALFGSTAQNPVFIYIISAVLFLMALSMFGVFDIQLPVFIQDKLAESKKGGMIGIFFLGMVFGLIAAPCAGPIVITLLSYIASTQNPLLGFILLFAYAFGLGILFIIIGTFSSILSSLPKAGSWMVLVKHFFGYAILILIVYFASPLISYETESYFYGFTILLLGIFFIREVFVQLKDSTLKNLSLAAGVMIILLSLSYIAGPAFRDILSERYGYESGKETYWVEELDQGLSIAKEQGKPYLIKFTADWCAYCKKMERTTFRDERVLDSLEGFVLIKIDLTVIDGLSRQLMAEYGIRGLPMIIVYDAGGNEVLRIDAFVDADKLLELLGPVFY